MLDICLGGTLSTSGGSPCKSSIPGTPTRPNKTSTKLYRIMNLKKSISKKGRNSGNLSEGDKEEYIEIANMWWCYQILLYLPMFRCYLDNIIKLKTMMIRCKYTTKKVIKTQYCTIKLNTFKCAWHKVTRFKTRCPKNSDTIKIISLLLNRSLTHVIIQMAIYWNF